MSARSFTRHLAREGMSFSQILGHARSRLVLIRYLEDRRVSLNRFFGCSVTRSLPHSIMRSGGGSPCRREKQEVCRAYLGRRSRAPLSDIDPATDPAHHTVQNRSRGRRTGHRGSNLILLGGRGPASPGGMTPVSHPGGARSGVDFSLKFLGWQEAGARSLGVARGPGRRLRRGLAFDRETLRGLAALGPFPHLGVRGFQTAREARRVE